MNTQKFTQKCTLECKSLYNFYKIVHYSVKICGSFSVNSFRLDRIGIKLRKYTKIHTKKHTTV